MFAGFNSDAIRVTVPHRRPTRRRCTTAVRLAMKAFVRKQFKIVLAMHLVHLRIILVGPF